jgi:DNA-binding response OmpR family regulator
LLERSLRFQGFEVTCVHSGDAAPGSAAGEYTGPGVAGREATRAGRPLMLTATEFDLLVRLPRYPRQVRTRQALHRAVWGYHSGADSNVVDVHIGHLRRKLGDPPLAHTVRGVGFTLRGLP